MSSSRSSRQDTLLAALQRKSTAAAPALPTTPEPTPKAEPAEAISSKPEAAPEPPRPTKKAAKPRRAGKPVQFWMHEEDRKLIRELSAWLAGQGVRPTDSMVVRASLRMAKTGGPLLEAYRQASSLDGRLKRD